MDDLLAIAYPGERAVEGAPDNLAEGITAGLVDVEHAVVIVRDEDETFDVRQGLTGVSGFCPWIGEGVRQSTAASARSDCQHLANDLDLIVRPRSETARDREIDQHEPPGRAAGRLSARGEAQLLSSRVASTRRRAAR
jgi:hypothetical protein